MRWEFMGKRFPSGAALFDHLVEVMGIVGEGLRWTALNQLFLIEDRAGAMLFRRQFRCQIGFNALREETA